MNTDKNKHNDKLKKENENKTMNKGNSVPNINPTGKQDPANQLPRSDEHSQAGRSVGNAPKSGGRQGGKSVEDGGQDVGSSAGSR